MYDGRTQYVLSSYKFTGKERDSESGLDEFGARYYSSQYGRFMTPDWSKSPIAVPYADYSNPQTLNLYAYVKNNPTTLFDRDGHCWAFLQALCNVFQRPFNWVIGNGFNTRAEVLHYRRDWLTNNLVTDKNEKVDWSKMSDSQVNDAYKWAQQQSSSSDALRQFLLTGGLLTAQQIVDYIDVTKGNSVLLPTNLDSQGLVF